MKLSTRARYGLRAMIQLAISPDGATGKAIAEQQHLPAAYLEQLMARLRNAELVTSIRGAKGRFLLSRPAGKINLAEIVQALDGPIEIADCTDVPYCRTDPAVCVLRRIFEGANTALRDYLAEVSLEELASQQQQQNPEHALDYCI